MTQSIKNTDSDTDISARYDRAKQFIAGFRNQNLVQNDRLYPNWIEGTSYFWYERAIKKPSATVVAKEYRLVNAEAGINQLAFDHQALATALSQACGKAVDPRQLPLSHVSIQLTPLIIDFMAFDRGWCFDAQQIHCEPQPLPLSQSLAPNEALSPDSKQVAFLKDYNLWLRDLTSGQEKALTEDGTDDAIYCAATTVWGTSWRRLGTPTAYWSPDGSRLLTVRRDRRQVGTLPMIDYVPEDGTLRPQLSTTKVAYPGDEHIETWLPVCIEVATGQLIAADYHPVPAGLSDYHNFWGNVFWWAADSQRAFFIDMSRGDRELRLVEFDITSGASRVVFEETSETHVNLVLDGATHPLHRFLPETDELLWWSERSGWGHLYIYDLLTGECKTLTAGDWRVADVVHVDQARREVWIQTNSRTAGWNPCYQDLCRVNMDTGELTPVYAVDAEVIVHHPSGHSVVIKGMDQLSSQPVGGVSPDGTYVIATHTRVDQPALHVLLDREGTLLMELETADTSSLPQGWQWPEPFTVKAGDGESDLFGMLIRPSDFSPDNAYPVINYIHGAPWLSAVPKGSFQSSCAYADRHYHYGAALAELGFVVVLLDGRGTPGRSKAFQDSSYGWIPDAARAEDHVGGLQQLAARYPFMDMTRVGIFGQGYRSSLQQFLERQDVYKVCVQLSLLDNRFTGAFEGDMWEGVEGPSADRQYPEDLVSGLKGKLLLMHAMTSGLSPAYPAAPALRVMDALQKANKDFDALILPNGGTMVNTYMYRRAFDYLVKHLLGLEPPKEYDFGQISM